MSALLLPGMPELSAAISDVRAAVEEARTLARASCPDPLDVVSSELWGVAAEAEDYALYVADRTVRGLATREGHAVLVPVDAEAAAVVRRSSVVVRLRVALDAATGKVGA